MDSTRIRPFTGVADWVLGAARMAGLLPKETTFGGTEDAGEGELEGGAAAGVGIESEGVDGSSVEL